MKFAKLGIGMIVAMAVCAADASSARADGSTGPFGSVAALVSYWSSAPTKHHVQVYVNGDKVYETPGAGPSLVRQYFACTDGSGIKPACNTAAVTGLAFADATRDGYLRWQDAATVVGGGLNVYLDFQLMLDRGDTYAVMLKTCHGDASFFGPVVYYVVAYLDDGFGPPFTNDCF